MFGPETFIERMADDSMAPRIARGTYVYVDPDEPAEHGRIVAACADGPDSATLVRLFVVECGRHILRALDPAWSDVALTDQNETMLRGVVVFVGWRV